MLIFRIKKLAPADVLIFLLTVLQNAQLCVRMISINWQPNVTLQAVINQLQQIIVAQFPPFCCWFYLVTIRGGIWAVCVQVNSNFRSCNRNVSRPLHHKLTSMNSAKEKLTIGFAFTEHSIFRVSKQFPRNCFNMYGDFLICLQVQIFIA